MLTPTITTRLIKIGNSQGIRLPKTLIEQVGFSDNVELEVQQNQIIIRPVEKVRAGWDEAFRAMAEAGDDVLLDGDVVLSDWGDEEWEWE